MTPPLVTKTTADLELSAAKSALVDTLAGFTKIESERVGAGGSLSASHAAYERLVAAITPTEAVALLAHESPVVRGYLAGHVLWKQPADAPQVYPLLFDSAAVGIMQGCMIGDDRIAQHVTGELAQALASAKMNTATYRALVALAMRGATDARLTPSVRTLLLGDAARNSAPLAKVEAVRLLSSSDPALVEGALTALFLGGTDDVATEVERLATHPNAGVRRSAASVLGHVPGPRARALLDALAADTDRAVKRSADAARLRHPSNSRADILAALASSNSTVVAVGLGRLANPWAVGLLIEAAVTAPILLSDIRPTTDKAVVELMTRVARDPSVDDNAELRREYATSWLNRVGAPTL
jgi:hypothetical protein